mmetsp:Transcript_26652/g.79925  ORF Transcript_26652/g.79925 Transcript_26652/m.79925 type:complete len:305 (-) Transcript_26652:11-925(-)
MGRRARQAGGRGEAHHRREAQGPHRLRAVDHAAHAAEQDRAVAVGAPHAHPGAHGRAAAARGPAPGGGQVRRVRARVPPLRLQPRRRLVPLALEQRVRPAHRGRLRAVAEAPPTRDRGEHPLRRLPRAVFRGRRVLGLPLGPGRGLRRLLPHQEDRVGPPIRRRGLLGLHPRRRGRGGRRRQEGDLQAHDDGHARDGRQEGRRGRLEPLGLAHAHGREDLGRRRRPHAHGQHGEHDRGHGDGHPHEDGLALHPEDARDRQQRAQGRPGAQAVQRLHHEPQLRGAQARGQPEGGLGVVRGNLLAS